LSFRYSKSVRVVQAVASTHQRVILRAWVKVMRLVQFSDEAFLSTCLSLHFVPPFYKSLDSTDFVHRNASAETVNELGTVVYGSLRPGLARRAFRVLTQSARGLAQSKTWRKLQRSGNLQSVFACGCAFRVFRNVCPLIV